MSCTLSKDFFRLREENPEILENCIGTAGFSMGEISALTFAESFSFEDGKF